MLSEMLTLCIFENNNPLYRRKALIFQMFEYCICVHIFHLHWSAVTLKSVLSFLKPECSLQLWICIYFYWSIVILVLPDHLFIFEEVLCISAELLVITDSLLTDVGFYHSSKNAHSFVLCLSEHFSFCFVVCFGLCCCATLVDIDVVICYLHCCEPIWQFWGK